MPLTAKSLARHAVIALSYRIRLIHREPTPGRNFSGWGRRSAAWLSVPRGDARSRGRTIHVRPQHRAGHEGARPPTIIDDGLQVDRGRWGQPHPERGAKA